MLTFQSATLSVYHIFGRLSSGFNRRIKISPPDLFPFFVIFPALFRVLCYYIMDFDNCQHFSEIKINKHNSRFRSAVVQIVMLSFLPQKARL